MCAMYPEIVIKVNTAKKRHSASFLLEVLTLFRSKSSYDNLISEFIARPIHGKIRSLNCHFTTSTPLQKQILPFKTEENFEA